MSMATGTGARIRRGTPVPRRRQPTRPRAPAKRPGMTSRALAVMPVRAETVRRLAMRAALLLLLCGVAVGIWAMKLPQMLGTEAGEALGRMGFAVRTIQIDGIDRPTKDAAYRDRAAVYDAALDAKSMALPLVDLGAVRRKLLGLGWIADASVSRRYPDTLVIGITERRPAAVWQYHGALKLIDRDGVVIAPVDVANMPEALPLLIGPGANLHVADYASLVETAPALKPTLAGATWIGDRRWDFRFQSGETLALPQGRQPSLTAVRKFADADGRARLLGRGFARFDMRLPDRMVVRVSREPGHKVSDEGAAAAPIPAKAAADRADTGNI